MVVVTKFYQRLRHRHYNVPARDIRKGHRWCMMDVFPRPTYCNVSEHHIVDGAVCDSCGIVVADQYMRDADLMLRCKELSNTSTNEMKHQWIKGNLPLCCVCAVCGEQCGDLPQLCDFRCCWCERTVHERCKSVIGEYCDLGQFCRNIIPPTCIRLKLVGVKGRRRVVVESARESSTPNWKPLIVMANRKSGNGDADHILRCFRALLNPVQVDYFNYKLCKYIRIKKINMYFTIILLIIDLFFKCFSRLLICLRPLRSALWNGAICFRMSRGRCLSLEETEL